jgi:hypothetical protein
MNMKRALLFLVCGAFLLTLSLPSVKAHPGFKKEFDNRYVKSDGTPAERALATAANAAKCGICHAGATKKVRNAYGMELEKHLKNVNPKNVAGVQNALEKVESARSPNGKTFGELIKEGKLPGG